MHTQNDRGLLGRQPEHCLCICARDFYVALETGDACESLVADLVAAQVASNMQALDRCASVSLDADSCQVFQNDSIAWGSHICEACL